MESTLLQGLNVNQKEAVETTEGFVRLIASAGSGKTKALAHRFAYLVRDLGVPQDAILCVTFTNKAAQEMKKRIRALIGDAECGMVCTFHGFGVRLLREDIHFLHYPKNFLILDTEDQEAILKKCFSELGITQRDITFKEIKDYISEYKHGFIQYVGIVTDPDIENLRVEIENAPDLRSQVLFRYLMEQRKCFGLDFQDLIMYALYILLHDEKIREKWQRRIQYEMVDEFQDVSDMQYQFADILSGLHKNLFVVGDPDQTIYSWRGAHVEFILHFPETHPGTKTIVLSQNYRSSSAVIRSANSLIRKNKTRFEKDMLPMRDLAGRSCYFHARDEREQAQWVVQQIQSLLDQCVNLSDIAVLYRAHYLSRSLEEAFLHSKIPYRIWNGVAFYKRKEIKDALSYLRLIVNQDDLSFRRVVNVPPRQFGKKKMEQLETAAEQDGTSLYDALKRHRWEICTGRSFGAISYFLDMVEQLRETADTWKLSDLFQKILTDSGYEAMLQTEGDQDRLDNLGELKKAIRAYEETAGEFVSASDYLAYAALFTDADEEETETVKIMTVHAAKGLEFPYVFVYELSEGVFPSRRVNTLEKMEEERRLAYVAFTRSRDFLFLANSDGINRDGSFRYPSRFIFDTEEANLEYLVKLPNELIESAQTSIKVNEDQMMKFSNKLPDGTRIRHPTFGLGRIYQFDDTKAQYVIKFDDIEQLRTMSLNAPLNEVAE